jgi:anthranilate synthase/indole-3-glycerol phosphate synthase/phosphoribosylanthranilate isomerase
MHGKLSRVYHDDRGLFRGLPQGILSTRYHSLSTQLSSLPPDLEVTSASEGLGVIMGLRHKKYTLEAVQYHPESILSASGDELMRNFLNLKGGTWAENPQSGVLDNSTPPFALHLTPPPIAAAA